MGHRRPYGNWVQVTDGHTKYARGAVGTTSPLHVVQPLVDHAGCTGSRAAVRLPPPDRRARLDFMPGSDVPVIRQPFGPGDRLPFWVGSDVLDAHFPVRPGREDPVEEEEPGGPRGGGGTWWSCSGWRCIRSRPRVNSWSVWVSRDGRRRWPA